MVFCFFYDFLCTYLRLRKDGVHFGYPAVRFRGTRTLQEAIQKSYPTDFFPPRKPENHHRLDSKVPCWEKDMEGDPMMLDYFYPVIQTEFSNMMFRKIVVPPNHPF